MNDILKELTVQERKENLSYIFYLLLGSISFLFVGLTGAYVFHVVTSVDKPITLHYGFFVATITILCVSLLANSAHQKIEHRDKAGLRKYWIIISVFLILFLSAQIYAWLSLFESLEGETYVGIQYLYIISIVHALHIIAGLPFHFSLLMKLNKWISSVSAENKPLLLHRFTIMIKYWHYLDILWLILMVVFVIMSFL